MYERSGSDPIFVRPVEAGINGWPSSWTTCNPRTGMVQTVHCCPGFKDAGTLSRDQLDPCAVNRCLHCRTVLA